LYVPTVDLMVISGLPMPKQTLPPSINAVPQSEVPPQTSASTSALPPYHWLLDDATIVVLNQNPTLKSSLTAVTSVNGKVPTEEPAVNAVAELLLPKRFVVAEVEESDPL